MHSTDDARARVNACYPGTIDSIDSTGTRFSNTRRIRSLDDNDNDNLFNSFPNTLNVQLKEHPHLTRVRTRGAHRAGARRVGQGLYSQPREEGLTLALQRLARAPSAYFVVLLA